MSSDELLTRRETAEILRAPASTLAQWAHKGYGPRFIRAGKRTLYPRTEVDRFISEQMADWPKGAA